MGPRAEYPGGDNGGPRSREGPGDELRFDAGAFGVAADEREPFDWWWLAGAPADRRVPVACAAREAGVSRQAIHAWASKHNVELGRAGIRSQDLLTYLTVVRKHRRLTARRMIDRALFAATQPTAQSLRAAQHQRKAARQKRAAEKRRLARRIARLQRIVDLWLDGRPAAEIAAAVGTSPQTIFVRVSSMRYYGLELPRRRANGTWRDPLPPVRPIVRAEHARRRPG